MSDWSTALKITLTATGQEIVIPYEAGRGIKQSLESTGDEADWRRSVNGTLIVVEKPLFRKYASEISCSDYVAPALGALWKGARVTVNCVATMMQPISGGAVTLGRTPVSNSIICYDTAGEVVPHTRSGRNVTCAGAVRVEYRPVLQCIVTDFSWDRSELSFESNSWSISLLEV